MPSGRLLFVVGLAGWICLGDSGFLASAHAQAVLPTAAPQQMIPYGVTSDAPYPSTDASSYPAAYPTTTSSYDPYDNASSRMASVPGGVVGYSAPPPDEAGLATFPQTSADTSLAPPPFDANAYPQSISGEEGWTWQVLPTGLMYKSYLAGNREPRLGTQWVHLRDQGWMWDATLGGRVGLLRYGTDNALWPEGYQLDVEGAGFVRMNLEDDRDVDNADFRAGLLQTTRQGPWEMKLGYYHLSSHLGDEYMIRHPDYHRINYVRDSIILGVAAYLNPSVRLYGEAGWAFYTDGGAKPWEFQFGIDWSSPEPTGFQGSPFFAINSHLRQENDFGGNMTMQTGWQWRGREGHLLRVGMQYFHGMSDQYQFYSRFEEQIGAGVWYDY